MVSAAEASTSSASETRVGFIVGLGILGQCRRRPDAKVLRHLGIFARAAALMFRSRRVYSSRALKRAGRFVLLRELVVTSGRLNEGSILLACSLTSIDSRPKSSRPTARARSRSTGDRSHEGHL